MDGAYVSAMAALAGSAIGALASIATSWLNQATQTRAAQRALDRSRREALYGDFIREASRLFVDAFENELEDPAKLVNLYALMSTMRLFGSPRTVDEAERVLNRIGAAYFAPNREIHDFSNITHYGELDPLAAFSEACRDEMLRHRI
jgi:hypothetical protein